MVYCNKLSGGVSTKIKNRKVILLFSYVLYVYSISAMILAQNGDKCENSHTLNLRFAMICNYFNYLKSQSVSILDQEYIRKQEWCSKKGTL